MGSGIKSTYLRFHCQEHDMVARNTDRRAIGSWQMRAL
jgi:hypothetical protein